MSCNFIPLHAGEPVGVVALSGPVHGQRLRAGLEVLGRWGHPLLLAPNLENVHGYLAGGDDERLAGLEWVLDRGARVLIGARGGYGATRILDRLPWRRLAEQQVRLVGFSDLTAVLNPLVHEGGAVQVHGPMVAAGLQRPANARRLHSVLDGRLRGRSLFRFAADSVLRGGVVRGRSSGFNLSMLCALIGTPQEPTLDGAVLFVEEVGEPLYRLDRMLTHLRASGRLRNVKALISGTLRGCRPINDVDEEWRRLLLDAAPQHAVVVAGLPFGHGATNMAFPIGVPVEVDTRNGRVRWSW